MQEPGHNRKVSLTKREKEILLLVYNEYSSKEIGEILKIHTGTVDTHRKKIMRKLGVSNTVGLIKEMIKNKIIEL